MNSSASAPPSVQAFDSSGEADDICRALMARAWLCEGVVSMLPASNKEDWQGLIAALLRLSRACRMASAVAFWAIAETHDSGTQPYVDRTEAECRKELQESESALSAAWLKVMGGIDAQDA